MLTYGLLVVYLIILVLDHPGTASLNQYALPKYMYIIGMARKLRQLKVSAEGI